MSGIADPLKAPKYLLNDMPRNVLLGDVRGIEVWCAKNRRMRPTLLHLCLARGLIR